MLLNTVVVEKGYKITVNKNTLAEPPARYDSVCCCFITLRRDADEDTGSKRSRCSFKLRQTRGIQQ